MSPPKPPGGSDWSGLPARWSHEWLVFRESFLFYFEPQKREVFRAAADEVFTKLLSGDRHWPEEPWTHARLRALTEDLRWAAQLLLEISEEPLHSYPEELDEYRLARDAARWGEEVERVARLILAAVDAGDTGDDA